MMHYIEAGSLPSDSGRELLVLFPVSEAVGWPEDLDEGALSVNIPGLKVDDDVHPSYEMLNLLFDPKPPPALPGIAIFRRFTDELEVVYVQIDGTADEAGVRAQVRKACSLVPAALSRSNSTGRAFSDTLAETFESARVPFVRTGRTSGRQWLIRSLRCLRSRGADIATVAQAGVAIAPLI